MGSGSLSPFDTAFEKTAIADWTTVAFHWGSTKPESEATDPKKPGSRPPRYVAPSPPIDMPMRA